jgi:two-component system, response regulator
MMNRRREILLVEDDSNDVVVAMRAFRRHGIDNQVRVLRDGAEALDYLLGEDTAVNGERRRVPKVIFLDLKMPKIDGLELLERLRAHARTRDVPVVIVTSSSREVDIEEAYRRGANSYVVKQFDLGKPGEYLIDMARYWLDLNRIVP